MAKKKNIDPLELGGPDLVNDIDGNDEFAPTEETTNEETQIDFLQTEGVGTDTEFVITTASADFANRDIRPDDTVFVKVADDLYVSGKVVAIDGEAPCYGLQIKALGNRVVSVHVSRVEKTAEADNVKRRLRFSNKTLKKWATPAE